MVDTDYRFSTIQFYYIFVKNTMLQNLVKAAMVQNQKLSPCTGRSLEYQMWSRAVKSIPKTCNSSVVLLTLLQVTTNLLVRGQKVQDWNCCRIMGCHWNLRLPSVLSQEWGAKVTAQLLRVPLLPAQLCQIIHAKLLDLCRKSLTVKESGWFSSSRIFFTHRWEIRGVWCVPGGLCLSCFTFQLQPLLAIQKHEYLMPGFFPFFSRFCFHCPQKGTLIVKIVATQTSNIRIKNV